MDDVYREPELVYRDIWEWDIITIHGAVNVMGRNHSHLDDCVWELYGAKCSCDEPKISSPVVDKNGRQLEEGWYRGDATGEARVLLGVEDGSLIPVKSGKVYRLRGPRKVEGYDSYAPASIWLVYAEPEPEPLGFWASLRERFTWKKAA